MGQIYSHNNDDLHVGLAEEADESKISELLLSTFSQNHRDQVIAYVNNSERNIVVIRILDASIDTTVWFSHTIKCHLTVITNRRKCANNKRVCNIYNFSHTIQVKRVKDLEVAFREILKAANVAVDMARVFMF